MFGWLVTVLMAWRNIGFVLGWCFWGLVLGSGGLVGLGYAGFWWVWVAVAGFWWDW